VKKLTLIDHNSHTHTSHKGEFKAAFEEAQKIDAQIVLGDRSFEGNSIIIFLSPFHGSNADLITIKY
jgi:hypothetical protein